jgi:arsenate reductase
MIVYWYPKCSTCKRAKKFLDDRNCSYELKDIKEETPSTEFLQTIVDKYSIPVRKLFNTSGLVYKELELKDKLESYDQKEQIQLLASNGMLIKRPICILEDAVLIGFKENEWKEKLGD